MLRCPEDFEDRKQLDCWEIPKKCLVMREVLGHGAFGQVIKAKLKVADLPWNNLISSNVHKSTDNTQEIDVAVKLLLGKCTIFIKIQHHIVLQSLFISKL